MTDSNPARSTYRDLIDHLVSLARGCVLADRIAAHGHADEVPHWDFMARLDNHPWRQTD